MWVMSQDGFYQVQEDGSVICLSSMSLPWEMYVGDSGDEVAQVEEVYPPKKLDPKNMAVKSDTEEDRERLWKSVIDYGRS